jgi:hypothetical protein
MAKKHDLPAMPFYYGDWRKAPEIQALDLDVRMIWFEMMGYMWESKERGYLTINGNPIDNSVITKLIGVDSDLIERAILQMEQYDVFSRREDGAIFCRKMVRDEEIRQLRSAAGKEGMRKRYEENIEPDSSFDITKPITPDITKDVTNTESESENETVIEKKKETKTINVPFEQFWNLYDKKKGRKDCEKKWYRLKDEDRQAIIEHVPKYVHSTPDKKFRKDPATYINQEAWKDEIILQNQPKDHIGHESDYN